MGFLDRFLNTFRSNTARNDELIKKINTESDTSNSAKANSIYKEFLEGKTFHLIHVNPNVYLAQRGARICIGKGAMNDTYMQQALYASKVLNRGHESVSEHANVIGILKIFKPHITNHLEDYTEMLSNMNFCHFSIRETEDVCYILLGGSPRSFIHLVRECRIDNFFINEYVKNFLYSSFASFD